MPRDSQGLYSLPAGNPVVPGTLIEAGWANPTMSDIGDALTGSLPRDGSAPMLAPLTLAATMPTLPRHATNKAYVDQFIAYATGLPLAGIIAQAGGAAPPGFLLCDGAAVSRVTYVDLFAAIGTIYGSGDNSTTFNLPNLQGQFIRGRDSSRTVGSLQAGSIQSHLHPVTDPGHNHTASQGAHNHSISTGGHSHGVNDPGHTHGGTVMGGASFGVGANFAGGLALAAISAAGTGISIAAVGDLGGNTSVVQPGVTNVANTTGLTVAAAGGTETVPQNVAMDYYIKAIQDSSASPGYLLGIESSDPNMIAIDLTTPSIPILDIKSNVALGTVKLDASGRIPLGLLPASSQQLLGYWDASSGQTPSQTYPSTNFGSGDTFIISVTGTLTVYDPVTLVAAPTVVSVGSLIQYIENSSTNPTGWYYVVASSTVAAGQVSLIPTGTISATNVQDGFAEVDGDLTTLADAVAVNISSIGTLQTGKVPQTSATGAATLPSGTDAQRPGSAILGQFRYNSQGNVFEGYTPNGWGQVGGGQMYGTAAVKAIFYNAQTIGENLTVAASQNGLSAGPVTVNNGFTVTVSNGSVWSIV